MFQILPHYKIFCFLVYCIHEIYINNHHDFKCHNPRLCPTLVIDHRYYSVISIKNKPYDYYFYGKR